MGRPIPRRCPLILNTRYSADRIHVVQYGSGNVLYGAERWILALIRYLNPERVKTTVVVTKDAPNCPTELVDEARRRGYDTHVVEAPGRFNMDGVRAFADFCRENEVDIVHSHGYKPDLYALLGRSAGGYRLLSTPHGWGHNRTPQEVLYETVNKVVFPFCDGVAPLSEDLLASVWKVPLRRPVTRLIMNGTDTGEVADASPSELPDGVPEDAFVVGYVGQLIQRKGIDTLLTALAALPPEGWHGIIVGDGPERERLEQRSRQLGLEGKVSFLGFRSDRLGLMKRMGLFVLPSAKEGIPRVMMEAMAGGVPCAGSDIPGVRDLVIPQQTGWLFPHGDAAALTDVIRSAMANPEDARDKAEAGRQRVFNHFSAQRMAHEYEALFAELMQIRRKAG